MSSWNTVQNIFNKYKIVISNKLNIIDLRNSFKANLLKNNINQINTTYNHSTDYFNGDLLDFVQDK